MKELEGFPGSLSFGGYLTINVEVCCRNKFAIKKSMIPLWINGEKPFRRESIIVCF